MKPSAAPAALVQLAQDDVTDLSTKVEKSVQFLKWFIISLVANFVLVPTLLLLFSGTEMSGVISEMAAWVGPAFIVFATVSLQNKVAAWVGLLANLYWNFWYLLGLVCFMFDRCL